MTKGTRRRVVSGALLLAAGCANLQPEDAAPAQALQVDPATVANYPGAKALADGIDRSGERALRDGDRLVLGVEVVLGEDVQRHLLEVIVHRQELGRDMGRVNFTASVAGEPLAVPSRHSRRLDLEFVLRAPDGTEKQRSRLHGVPEFVVDESFLPAIQLSREEHPATFSVALLRLLQVAQMLGEDAILQSLLHQTASVPLDLSLLWRRELMLLPYFEQGRETDVVMGAYELPFDLFLNDSLLVRLVATVTDPHGAAGAVGGIVGLRAQDARHPERHLKVQVLGAARGPWSDWQHDGVLAAYGYVDEGVGLAFSPDGRSVAMPGAGDDVALRDLTAVDPSVATMLLCEGRAQDLAYLDDNTLLVATKHHLQVFDVTRLDEPRLLASHEVPDSRLCALEVVAGDTVFVGGHGFEIARWRFASDRSLAPQREQVQAVQKEQWHGNSTAADGTVAPFTGWFTRNHETGWLLGVAADCVVARSDDAETQWRQGKDGAWQRHELERVDEPMSRLHRLPDVSPTLQCERVSKGARMVRSPVSGAHAWGPGPVSLTGNSHTRILSWGVPFASFCHGFSADGRYYAYVAPGYRLFVDVERFLAAEK